MSIQAAKRALDRARQNAASMRRRYGTTSAMYREAAEVVLGAQEHLARLEREAASKQMQLGD